MLFSFCLIGKNEASRLDKCLAPLQKTGMEIVFLDTGSTDDTVAIAKKYTDKVFHFTWVNDFSAARNFAAEKATHDHVLFIDCDEYTEDIDIRKIGKLIDSYPHAIGQIKRRNLCEGSSNPRIFVDMVERLYCRKDFHYTGRIHEQVTPLHGNEMLAYEIPLTVFHDGYFGTPEERAEKARRNILLLEKDLEEDPNDPYTYYQLGQAYELINDHENACIAFEKGCSLPCDKSLPYVHLMFLGYGHSLIASGRPAEATALKERCPFCKDNADFIAMLGDAYLAAHQIPEAIKEYKYALTLPPANTEGTNSFLSAHNLGCIYEALGNECAALRYYKLAAPQNPPSQERYDALSQRLSVSDVSREKRASFLIFCDNNADKLPLFLDALKEQTIGPEHLELLFIDNHSDDQTSELLSRFEQNYPESVILLPLEEKISPFDAFSIGLSYASCDYVGFLYPHSIPSADYCRHLSLAARTYSCDAACANAIPPAAQGLVSAKELHFIPRSQEEKKAILGSGLMTPSLTGKLFKKNLVKPLVSSASPSEEALTLLLLLHCNSFYFYGTDFFPPQKPILLFKGVHPTLDYLADSYSDALRDLGEKTLFFDMQNFEASAKTLLSLGKEGVRASVAFNNIGFSLTKKDGGNLLKELKIPAYNLLVDHPMYYFDTLNDAPENGHVLCADQNHVRYVKDFYPSVRRCSFLPTGGTLTCDYQHLPSFSERPIDILFLGNFKSHKDKCDTETAKQLLDFLKSHTEYTLEDAARFLYPGRTSRHCKEYIEENRFVETHLCSLYREEALFLLLEAGFLVEVYGNGWEQSKCAAHPRFSLHAPVSCRDGLRLMQNAKIVFNNLAWFKAGGSERVFNAALQGSIVLTDSGSYLDNIFTHMESALIYPLDDMQKIPLLAGELLASPEKAESIRKNAYEIVAANHTWLHRAKQLLSILGDTD